ncbi:SAM-dependent methyltransferase [Streptomyces sp. NBC_00536]|uniref:SAM-dependent methyltransferase n=1 Tax=Streptomyces sp. NBC_00536 TaxID=2975769 RepID=UPI002E809538|nr:SAM-dependent methyltransferase [Streptomyces sp. NBC_00536]
MRTPSVARIYDRLLGGVDNHPVDQKVCEDLLGIAPGSRTLALASRAFLRRAVRVLARDYGIRQFLEHGCGLPARDNVHEVAQTVAPGSRVVYIDNDPLVLAHARARLVENPWTAVVSADVRDTAAVFAAPEVRGLIRPGEPTAALFVAVSQCLPDQDVLPMLERVKERLAPGSFLVVCQYTSRCPEVRDRVTSLIRDATLGGWGRVREEHEVRGFLHGLEIIEPGLGDVADWRPDPVRPALPRATDLIAWGGVGRIV